MTEKEKEILPEMLKSCCQSLQAYWVNQFLSILNLRIVGVEVPYILRLLNLRNTRLDEPMVTWQGLLLCMHRVEEVGLCSHGLGSYIQISTRSQAGRNPRPFLKSWGPAAYYIWLYCLEDWIPCLWSDWVFLYIRFRFGFLVNHSCSSMYPICLFAKANLSRKESHLL